MHLHRIIESPIHAVDDLDRRGAPGRESRKIGGIVVFAM
jgi:hypothetical protein